MKTRFIVVALILVTMTVRAERTKLKPGFNAFSPAQDVEMGKQVAQQAASLRGRDREVDLVEVHDKAQQVKMQRPQNQIQHGTRRSRGRRACVRPEVDAEAQDPLVGAALRLTIRLRPTLDWA